MRLIRSYKSYYRHRNWINRYLRLKCKFMRPKGDFDLERLLYEENLFIYIIKKEK